MTFAPMNHRPRLRASLCLLLCALASPVAAAPEANPAADRVIARIGARAIRVRDIPKILDELPGLERPRVMDEFTIAAVVRRYVTDEVVLEHVRRAAKTVVSPANRREVIIAFVNDEVERRLRANPPDVEKYYRDHIRAFTDPNQARVRVIRVATRDEAQQLVARLKSGEDFLRVAEEKSLGVGSVERTAAILIDDWGYAGAIGSFPAATTAIFQLAPGAFTPEPIERGGSWYLFRLDALLPAKNKTLDEIRHKVTESCHDARRKELKPSVVQSLLDEARVEFYLSPPAVAP